MEGEGREASRGGRGEQRREDHSNDENGTRSRSGTSPRAPVIRDLPGNITTTGDDITRNEDPSSLSANRNNENGRRIRITRVRIPRPTEVLRMRIRDPLTEEVPSGSSGQNRRRAYRAAEEHLHPIQISEDHIRNAASCAICLTDFELGVEACHLQCGHIYHPTCILRWLESRNTCPLCRFQLPL